MPTMSKDFSKKTKTAADRKLIKEVFAVDPVSWARYPDGRLVFISPTGQKFGYTQEQFDNITEAVRQEKNAKKKLAGKKSKRNKPSTINLNTVDNPPDDFLDNVPDTVPTSQVKLGRRGG